MTYTMKISIGHPVTVLYVVLIYSVWSELPAGKLTSQEKCGQAVHVSNDTIFTLSFLELKHYINEDKNQVKICEIEIWTDPGFLIRAVIQYIPEKQSCDSNYLHIGNDPFRPKTKSLTSYIICNSTQNLEIVSRDNYLWFVHSHTQDVTLDVTEIQIQIYSPVTCNNSMFECSPVQCVPESLICDGITDCDNGRDEYCTPPNNVTDRVTDDSCFICDDNTCILPQLPRYHADWGKNLWYLCDGIWHCKNGTDERMDMCFITKKASDLLKCVPIYSELNINTSAVMWPDRKCDGMQDCLDNKDEIDCGNDSDSERISPAAILLIVCSVLAVIIGFVICQVRIDKTKESGESDGSQRNFASRYRRCYKGGSMDLLERTRLDTVAEEDPEQSTV